ncbi:hypothetical protein [Pseudomonas sp. RGM 3321]|uniref:hypothetical protein n=1 Tax=Pseudomonas sp. RGM 3321 TaxID=2930089 RepID=UPI001FCA81B8|nr:hypothetical protein [Pseudomonas sp. RGM 3321]MCJ2371929.1 hypothetical protein [Pseudomonas sp. RGM 3321]
MVFSLPPYKAGPFRLSKSKDGWTGYLNLLAMQLESLGSLPDFSEDKGVFVFSDYGGEHPGAAFRTYSFLFVSADKIGCFNEKSRLIRSKFSLGTTEISFKDINYGPTSRAITEYLNAANNFLHGILVTVAIDASISTMFGVDKKSGQENLEKSAAAVGAGKWKYKRLEKMYRIYGPLVLLLDLLCEERHKIFWQSDRDAINEDGNGANFKHAQHHLMTMLHQYSGKKFELVGFAKSFEESSYFNDLLSLPDLAAGMVQDLLRDHYGAKSLEVNEVKASLCRWLASESKFLQKYTLCLTSKGGSNLLTEVRFDAVQQ